MMVINSLLNFYQQFETPVNFIHGEGRLQVEACSLEHTEATGALELSPMKVPQGQAGHLLGWGGFAEAPEMNEGYR